jgi:methyl-accepting chemotaxis protein
MENFSNKQLMGMFVISSDLKPLQKRINKAVLIIVLWGVIIAVVALFFSIFFIDKINSNIKNITKVTEKVARKDLNVKVKIVSNDELGDLADNINLMIDALHAVITDVNKSAKILSKSSFGISSITNQISDNAQQQATQLEQLNSSIQTTAQSSHLASVITGQKVATALQLDVNIEKSVNTMSDIQKSSKKIENALKIIFEIAAQTNMLAINAAVEAAIAGQNGKGFAVVASEVKSLADKTKKYTKEISEIISTNNSQVESGVKMLKEVREAIKGIVEGIQTIAAELDAISNNTKEQAITMEENSKLTAINANATEQVAFSAKNLSENAANLYQLIDSFTLK